MIKLDSIEVINFLGDLAKANDAEKVVLQTSMSEGWEYSPDKKLVQQDVPILTIKTHGKQIIRCLPILSGKEKGQWGCALFDDKVNLIKEWAVRLP